MNETMIMRHIQCARYLIRTNYLILFILTMTLSHAMIQPNPLHGTIQPMVHSKRISAFNNNIGNTNTNINNNNRFSSIRQILYHTPNWHANETLRWHKINIITNLFKYRVKRKAIPIFGKQLIQSNESIASNAIIYERNSSTNIIDFSHNKQIREHLTFVHLNMLLNQQRSIHNVSVVLALNLSNNVIQQIDPNVLKSLEHVRRLDLSHNHMQWFNVSVTSNHIQWLSLSHNQLHTFDGKNLTNLMYLDLSCNNIEHSTHIQLNELSDLEYINLSGNHLHRIQQHVFEKLIKLKVISLSFNRLESINNDLFRHLIDIEALNLSHNQIKFVESASFSYLPKLQYLDLSHNFIDAFSLHGFLGIPNLIKLSIAFNTQLEDALQGFISSWSLKHLDMSGTGLCEIPNAITQSVRTLNISNNDFTVIRCGDLDSYPLLQYLDVSSCQVSDIEDDALGRLDMLKTLYMNNNNIARVPSSLPVNLVRLFLQNNRITEIQSATFSHLINLEVVNLSGNQLKYLPSLSLPRLMILDVRAAGLRSLSQSIIKMSPELKIVYLDDNPIKCNELLGVAEWATPCRTDDFSEIGTVDGDSDFDANDEDDRIDMSIFTHCVCDVCQTAQLPINLSKLHCRSKNITTFKRTRMPENSPTQQRSNHSIEAKTEEDLMNGKLLSHTKSKNNSQSLGMTNDTQTHTNQDLINNRSVTLHQQLNRENETNFHDNLNAYSIKIKTHNRTLVNLTQNIESVEKLNVLNIKTENHTKSPQSGNIITNDIQNGNNNKSATKSSLLETASIFNTKLNASATETINEKGAKIETSTSSQSLGNGIKMTNLTKNIMEKITDKKKSHQIELLKTKESLDRNRTPFTSDDRISHKINEQNIRRNDDDELHTNINRSRLSTKSEEMLTTTEFPNEQTTTIYVGNNPSINVEEKRFSQHSKYDDSDHKENKSKVNWNMNEAISTTDDNLQRHRNLVVSSFHATVSDNVVDEIHINEINKNQLANRNQLNEKHTPNVTVTRDKYIAKESQSPRGQQQQEQKYPLMKKCEPSLKENKNENLRKGLNKRINILNTFTEIGVLINDGNKNGQQISTMNGIKGSTSPIDGNVVTRTKSQRMSNGSVSIDVTNKARANIVSTEMSTISSILSDENRRLHNDIIDTMANSSDHTIVERKSSNFEIEADNVKVDDENASDNNREKNKQTQQIKNTVGFTTNIKEEENPLIGRISQNVSIIDNEQQFERHINHSMHRQNTFESNTNTKLQSANENVQSPAQNVDNRFGDNDDARSGSGDVSDNSAIHGVSEQWNDERVTSGHSSLYVVIGISIAVFVTLNLLHIYRYKKRYNSQRNGGNGESAEQNRQVAQNILAEMQMNVLNSIHYTDTPIDLW